MSDPRSNALVHGYLQRLDQQLAALPAKRRSALREQIQAHISDARSEIPGDDPLAVEELLACLGDPSEIVAEEPSGHEHKLEAPDGPSAAPAFPDARGSAVVVLEIIAAVAALGAAALAAFGTDTGAWLTRSVLGENTDTSVSFTLRELAATHAPPGYSSDLWIIGAGVIALSLGGVVALFAGRRFHGRWISGVGISLGLFFVQFLFYFKPDPPGVRLVSGGELLLWSNGSAQTLVRGAIALGWTAFLASNLAGILVVRRRRQRPVVTFPLPANEDPSRSF